MVVLLSDRWYNIHSNHFAFDAVKEKGGFYDSVWINGQYDCFLAYYRVDYADCGSLDCRSHNHLVCGRCFRGTGMRAA